jgi:hypothetical protein
VHESAFLAQSVNRYLNDEIAVPECEAPLSPAVGAKLVAELRSAQENFKTERLSWLERASARLHNIDVDGLSDGALRIARSAPKTNPPV